MLTGTATPLLQRSIIVLSHNALSMRAITRRHDLAAFFEAKQADVILFQGTRIRAQQPVESSLLGAYRLFDSGYGPSSNSHAGVAVWLRKHTFAQRQFKSVAWPSEPCLRGRAIVVRTSKPLNDNTWISAYPPPLPTVMRHEKSPSNFISGLTLCSSGCPDAQFQLLELMDMAELVILSSQG